jgi:beta-alanine degradation protein BauB
MKTDVLTKDPVKLAAGVYKVLLDNDRVRVLDVTLKPGEKSPEHTHPDMLIYAIQDGRVKFTYPDGRTESVELEAGETMYVPSLTHAAENIGTKTLRALNIEFKR